MPCVCHYLGYNGRRNCNQDQTDKVSTISMETIISRFYHIISIIATRSAIHLVRCCHGQMSLIAVSYPIIFIHDMDMIMSILFSRFICMLHTSIPLYAHNIGSFIQRASFQLLGKFLFVRLFYIVSIIISIRLLPQSEFLAFLHSMSRHGAVYYCAMYNCENFYRNGSLQLA